MDKQELNKILKLHKKWILGQTGGKKANLSYANLRSADLSSANLRYADLSYADLSYANLSYANLRYANLSSADLSSANLSYANLSSADLSYANLSYANLRYADLRSADLSSANLSSADLSYADLSYAKINYQNNLAILKDIDSKGNIYAWKYIQNGKSPYQHATYEIGKTYIEKDYDDNEIIECGKGQNVATLIWCYLDSIGKNNIEFLKVQFKSKDIVAIPYMSDGKFRVKKMKIIKKYTLKQVENMLKIKEK